MKQIKRSVIANWKGRDQIQVTFSMRRKINTLLKAKTPGQVDRQGTGESRVSRLKHKYSRPTSLSEASSPGKHTWGNRREAAATRKDYDELITIHSQK